MRWTPKSKTGRATFTAWPIRSPRSHLLLHENGHDVASDGHCTDCFVAAARVRRWRDRQLCTTRSKSRCGGCRPINVLPVCDLQCHSRRICRRGRCCISRLPHTHPTRWERPDGFDVTRPLKLSLGWGGTACMFGAASHAGAEMEVSIGALLDRLPNLRLDPDAEPPASSACTTAVRRLFRRFG
jgi:hypothetical protein